MPQIPQPPNYRGALGGFPDLLTPSGLPNLEPRDEISITDTGLAIQVDDAGEPSRVQMRWSWPAPGGKPVYNFRSERRRFASGRCLIPADGFYDFADPEPRALKRARKRKWLFAKTNELWSCVAGVVRTGAGWMFTVEFGPDIQLYHSRQAVLGRTDWRFWLAGEEPEVVLRPSPVETLQIERAS